LTAAPSLWRYQRLTNNSPLRVIQVLVSLDYGERVLITSAVRVRSLVFTGSDDLAGGGTVQFFGSQARVNVTDTLVFSRGTFSGSGAVGVSPLL
jgi:hypothetical protein